MLTHPSLDQLKALKLDGMAEAFLELVAQDAARDLTHAEWLALLLDREVANRGTKRFQTRLRAGPPAPQPSLHRGCRLPSKAPARQSHVPAARNLSLDCRQSQSPCGG
jgi:IstB-like ATP binding protein